MVPLKVDAILKIYHFQSYPDISVIYIPDISVIYIPARNLSQLNEIVLRNNIPSFNECYAKNVQN